MADWGDYASIINAIIGGIGALKHKKITELPENPETTAARQRLSGYIDNSPTRNMLGSMLESYVKQGANDQWTPAPAKYGYNPYPNGAPKYDLSGMLPWLHTSMNPSAPQVPDKGGDRPTPDDRGANRGAGAPFGTGVGDMARPGGDPFAASGATGAPATLSPEDRSGFLSFFKQYGRAAGEAVLAILTQSPGMGIKAAIDLWRAHSGNGGQPQYQPGQSTPFTTDAGVTKLDANGNPIPEPRQNFTPSQGPGYEDFWGSQNDKLRNGGGPSYNDMGRYIGYGPYGQYRN